jgi:hypothetical protein
VGVRRVQRLLRRLRKLPSHDWPLIKDCASSKVGWLCGRLQWLWGREIGQPISGRIVYGNDVQSL